MTATFGVEVGLVQVRAQQYQQRAVTLGKVWRVPLGGTLLALAAGAPAALAILPPPDPAPAAVLGPNRAGYPPISHVRTVVVGGMPGWQITLIALGAALAAAATAVILYRLWTARRHLAQTAT